MADRPPPDDDIRRDPSDEDVEQRFDPDIEPEPGDDAEVAAPITDDPDLDAARAQAPTQDPISLTTEELRPEEELIEYEPPFEPTPETASGSTAADERAGETLDDRLAQEEPDQPADLREAD
jgi:hypothetical protein